MILATYDAQNNYRRTKRATKSWTVKETPTYFLWPFLSTTAAPPSGLHMVILSILLFSRELTRVYKMYLMNVSHLHVIMYCILI